MRESKLGSRFLFSAGVVAAGVIGAGVLAAEVIAGGVSRMPPLESSAASRSESEPSWR